MKLLLDENLSPRLVSAIEDLFPGSVHVRDVGLLGQSDESIWRFARDRGFAVTTKDSDFEQRAVFRGPPPKVVWIRLGNRSTNEVARILRAYAEAIRRFLEEQETAILILD